MLVLAGNGFPIIRVPFHSARPEDFVPFVLENSHVFDGLETSDINTMLLATNNAWQVYEANQCWIETELALSIHDL